MIRLSQGHLKVLETCPRKFEYIYFDRLTLPISPEQQLKMQWGKQFHLLMQQRELGLPISPFLEQSPRLNNMVNAIVDTAPELFSSQTQSWRQAEHVRTLAIDNYLLTVIYDLLILNTKQAYIIDWKTYPLPKRQAELAKDWQTGLYLYLLAETSEYLPKQISFTYWFIQSEPRPQSLVFRYNLRQHRQTQKDLSELLERLQQWLDNYRDRGESFPQLPISSTACGSCNFAHRCERQGTSLVSQRHLPQSLEQIPEISLA
jgi:hypothetical protein